MLAGLVCDACDAVSPLMATDCGVCGVSLDVRKETAITTARTCGACGNELSPGHRFCGFCGTPSLEADAFTSREFEHTSPLIDAEARNDALHLGATLQTEPLQATHPFAAHIRLVLIGADGSDAITHELRTESQSLGRTEGDITFPDDNLLSDRHATLHAREGKVFVRDEESQNGVFVRIRQATPITNGQVFMLGEQVLVLEHEPPSTGPSVGADGTYFFGSPRKPARIVLSQRLIGGAPGSRFRFAGDTVLIGREGNDVNFPGDSFLSARHAQLAANEFADSYALHDLGSKNGTFVRILAEEVELIDGDYLLVGRQLFRIEVPA